MDEKTGRKDDVYIEQQIYNLGNGFEYKPVPQHMWKVYADEGMRQIILDVEGVTDVLDKTHFDRYTAYVDKRYDLDIVGENIIKAVNEATLPESFRGLDLE